MDFILGNDAHKKKIIEMTDGEYSAEVDRILNKKDIRSSDDAMMFYRMVNHYAFGRWGEVPALLDGFLDTQPSDDAEVYIDEIYLYKFMSIYEKKDGCVSLDKTKDVIDFALKTRLKGSFYAHCIILNLIIRKLNSGIVDHYADYYKDNEFLTRIFASDDPVKTLTTMAFEAYSQFDGWDRIKAFNYLNWILMDSKYIDDIALDIEALEAGKDCLPEMDFGEKEFFLSEYYYYAKSDYDRAIEFAKIASSKGNVGAYAMWALSLYSDLCKKIDNGGDKDLVAGCDSIVKIIDLTRLSLDGFAKNRGVFFRNMRDIDFIIKNIPVVLNNFSTPELAVKLCEMASKGSPFEQFLVLDRKSKLDNDYDFVSEAQVYEWAENIVNSTEIGSGKIPLGRGDLMDSVVKKINKKRIEDLLSH